MIQELGITDDNTVWVRDGSRVPIMRGVFDLYQWAADTRPKAFFLYPEEWLSEGNTRLPDCSGASTSNGQSRPYSITALLPVEEPQKVLVARSEAPLENPSPPRPSIGLVNSVPLELSASRVRPAVQEP